MPMIRFVIFAGITVAMMVFIMMVIIVLLRLSLLRKERHRKRFYAVWRPLLIQTVAEPPKTLPPVSTKDSPHFLYYWNYFHESILGPGKARLNELMRRTGMDQVAVRMLKHGTVRKQLIAIVTLGHLGERSVWHDLLRLAASDHPLLSLTAARAMIHIDAQAAIPVLTPLIGTRSDWSPAKVAGFLMEAGAHVIATPLAEVALSAVPEMAVRLIRYLEVTQSVAALPTLRILVGRCSNNDTVRIACLSLIGRFKDPQDLETVRLCLEDPNGQVRAHAAVALGKMGMQGDEIRLIGLLRDPQWDVRYRAAEALASLPFLSRERLAQIQAEQTDEQAKELLHPFLVPIGSPVPKW